MAPGKNCRCKPAPFATLNQRWAWKKDRRGSPIIREDEDGVRYAIQQVWGECPNCHGDVRLEDRREYHNLPA